MWINKISVFDTKWNIKLYNLSVDTRRWKSTMEQNQNDLKINEIQSS